VGSFLRPISNRFELNPFSFLSPRSYTLLLLPLGITVGRCARTIWSLSGRLTTSSSEDEPVRFYISTSPGSYHTFRVPQLGCGRQSSMNTGTFDLTEFLLRSFGLHTLANYPRCHSHSSWNPFFMSLGSHFAIDVSFP
jgi:hypothetical protein